MDKSKLKKTAWKVYKIAMFVIAPFFLSLVGNLIFPSEAELAAEKFDILFEKRRELHEERMRSLSERNSSRELELNREESRFESELNSEYDLKFTSDKFMATVFIIWGIIALFFIVRGTIRWVARTAAAAVKETNKKE
jgi:hypothetical protein